MTEKAIISLKDYHKGMNLPSYVAEMVEQIEIYYLHEALEHCGGHIGDVAQNLSVSLTWLRGRLHKYDMEAMATHLKRMPSPYNVKRALKQRKPSVPRAWIHHLQDDSAAQSPESQHTPARPTFDLDKMMDGEL